MDWLSTTIKHGKQSLFRSDFVAGLLPVLGCFMVRFVGYFFVVVCSVVIGCGVASGQKYVKVTGKLVRNGAPAKLKGDSKLPLPPGESGASISFVHLDGPLSGQDEPGVVNADDGTFEMIGILGKGIPAGKYQVVLKVGPFGQPDGLKDQFSRKTSKLETTVPDTDAVNLVLDLEKK
jgi:hypothetical protein